MGRGIAIHSQVTCSKLRHLFARTGLVCLNEPKKQPLWGLGLNSRVPPIKFVSTNLIRLKTHRFSSENERPLVAGEFSTQEQRRSARAMRTASRSLSVLENAGLWTGAKDRSPQIKI